MSNHEKSDKYFKWLIVFAILYFLGHLFASVARAQQPTPHPPIMQCWSNGFGTVQCIQL